MSVSAYTHSLSVLSAIASKSDCESCRTCARCVGFFLLLPKTGDVVLRLSGAGMNREHLTSNGGCVL